MAGKKSNRPHRSKPYENKVAERRIVRNPGMAKRNPAEQQKGEAGESQISEADEVKMDQPTRAPQTFDH